MICLVGFEQGPPPAVASCGPIALSGRQHRRPCRQRSLLSESIRSTPLSLSRAGSCESMEGVSGCEEGPDCGSPMALGAARADGPTQSGFSPGGVDIPYTRVARERIDRAEAQGRRRDEQLEMLHAVRQYMAQSRAHQQLQPSSSAGSSAGSSCSAQSPPAPQQRC